MTDLLVEGPEEPMCRVLQHEACQPSSAGNPCGNRNSELDSTDVRRRILTRMRHSRVCDDT
ncbi:MAG: hypothetical protein OEM15_01020 [Myxococcales bacterium]|nr:hypothetical protein [Myxococcales bacterium]MDH3483778.1 hypothetical protein [Myxococcales bacterium]